MADRFGENSQRRLWKVFSILVERNINLWRAKNSGRHTKLGVADRILPSPRARHTGESSMLGRSEGPFTRGFVGN